MALISGLIKKAEGDFTHTKTHTHTQERYVKMEAEVGVMHTQANKCWQSPETGKDKEWTLIGPLRRQVLLTP